MRIVTKHSRICIRSMFSRFFKKEDLILEFRSFIVRQRGCDRLTPCAHMRLSTSARHGEWARLGHARGPFPGKGAGSRVERGVLKCWMTHCLPEFPQSLPRLYYNEPPNDETRYANIASQNADEDGRPYENVISKNQRCLRGGVRRPCRRAIEVRFLILS